MDGDDLASLITPDNVRRCRVCQLGALMVSSIRLKNSLVYDMYGIDDVSPDGNYWAIHIKNLFKKKQIVLIESAFERGEGFYEDCLDVEGVTEAVSFGKKYLDDTERMLAIFENMLQNDGIFKP